MTFTSPSGSVNSLNINLNAKNGTSGPTIFTRAWAVFVGSAVNTQVRGNLSVPYGSVSSPDFIYGASGTSLANTIPTLATIASISNVANQDYQLVQQFKRH